MQDHKDGWVGRKTIDAMLIPLFIKTFFAFCYVIFFSFSYSPPRTDSAAAALALSTIGDDDLLGGFAALGPEGFDLKEALEDAFQVAKGYIKQRFVYLYFP